jgi:hypothetical protein
VIKSHDFNHPFIINLLLEVKIAEYGYLYVTNLYSAFLTAFDETFNVI